MSPKTLGNPNQPLPILGPGGPLIPIFDQIPGQEGFLGDQIRGFGYSRAGDIDSALRFISNFAFDTRSPFGPNQPPLLNNPSGFPSNFDGSTNDEGLRQKKTVIDFLMAFDTNLKPIVGQQITLSASTPSSVGARIDLLEQRAAAGDCDLVAKASFGDREHGFLYAGGQFTRDQTGAPPGSGVRIGIDRDLDGILDGDEQP